MPESTRETLAINRADINFLKQSIGEIKEFMKRLSDEQKSFVTREEYLERGNHIERLEGEYENINREFALHTKATQNQFVEIRNMINAATMDFTKQLYNVNVKLAYWSGGAGAVFAIVQFLLNKYF